jgi:N-acetylglucosaminyl-diphospho-decaprenol L-rhamnosyltransferase
MNENSGPISLFVVHWNQPDECIATVRRLLAQQVELQVLIVDNASTPEAYDLLRAQLGRDTEIVRLEENKGWGPALNIALANWLKSGQNPYCLISAHDAAPTEDCIKLLVRAMEHDSRIAIVCPQYPDSTVPRFSCVRGVYQDSGVPLASGTSQLVDIPHGTLMLVRRDCLAEIGLFDERYFAYGDEHELGMRARRRGWKIALVWGAIVANRGTWTPSPWRSYLFTRNSLLLVHDYCGKLCAWLRAALILVNTVRFLIFPPNQGFAFSPGARWKGVSDYFAGRYGKPSMNEGSARWR